MDSLDDHNSVGALGRPTIDPAMDGNLAYRITGAQVVLTFDYRSNDGVRPGNPSSGDLACHLTARLNGGWHSRGSEVHYSDAYGCKKRVSCSCSAFFSSNILTTDYVCISCL